MSGPQRLAMPAEVAEWLQVSVDYLRKMRQRGDGPKYVKQGRAVRYAWPDVHRWADARRRASTKGGA